VVVLNTVLSAAALARDDTLHLLLLMDICCYRVLAWLVVSSPNSM
jgi:hypothetical protein